MAGYKKLQPPFRGLHEDHAYEDQPPETTREADDVRTIDPETRRRRISQREGMSAYTTAAVSGTEKIDAGVVVTVSENQIEYSELTFENTPEEWGQATPTGRTCSALQVDRQGNVLAIDGLSSLVKYNSEGREVLTFNFPVEDESGEIRAFRVSSVDQLFVGVSAGGDQSDARLYSYLPDEDEGYVQRWEINSGDFIEDVALNDKQSLLYTIQNDPSNWRAWLRVYENISSTVPTLAWERQIPYPCNALAVKPDGSAMVACEEFTDRGLHPSGEGTPVSEDWTPNDLDDAGARIHAWLDAKDLSALYDDGDEVLFWPDKSGNSRTVGGANGTSPTFLASAYAGLPAVHFDGVDNRLNSSAGFSTFTGAQSSQKNLIPGCEDIGCAIFIAFRPTESVPSSAGCVLSQYQTTTTNWREIWAHAAARYAFPPTFSLDDAFFRVEDGNAGGTNGTGTNGQPVESTFNADNKICIMGIVHDPESVQSNVNVVWVNGNPADRFDTNATTAADTSIGATSLGSSANGSNFFEGDILEVLVLRDYDPGSGRTIIEHPTYPDTATDPASDTEFERVLGYLAHRWAAADVMDEGGASYPFAYDEEQGAPSNSAVIPSVVTQLNSTGNLLAKFGPTRGDPKWVLHNDSDNPNVSGTSGVGGLGYGVAVNSQGEVYSVGPGDANDVSSLLTVRKIFDTGDSFDITEATGANTPWRSAHSNAGSGDFTYKYLRLDVDTFDNLFVPLPGTSGAGFAQMFTRDAGVNGQSPSSNLVIGNGSGTGLIEARAVAVFPDPPEYEEDTVERAEFVAIGLANGGGQAATGFIYVVSQPTAGDSITITDGQGNTDVYEWNTSAIAGSITVTIGTDTEDSADNLANAINGGSATIEITATALTAAGGDVDDGVSLVSDNVGFRENQPMSKTEASAGDVELRGMFGGSDADPDDDTVRKFRLVETGDDVGAARRLHAIVASNGALADVTGGGAPTVLDSTALNAQSTHVSFAILFEKIYVTDGQSRDYKVIDFRPGTPTVSDYESEDAGKPPARCAFLSSWRERLVFLRPADDPHMWHMSEAGKPLNNDLEPPVITPASAIAGTNTERAGLCPDIINGFIPYSNDTAIFGCDHSLYLLRGDPQAGGQFDRISDQIGMAFGEPWAKDPEGIIYLFSNQGGIVSMAPTGQFYRLSHRRIERQLQEVDLSTSRIVLVWDYDREGLLVLQTAITAGTGLLSSWFWDKKHDFWARDRRGTTTDTGVQPSCAFVLDGDDPDDRTILFGCEDGIVRQVDPLANDDDGVAIGSSVVFGPYQYGDDYEMRLIRLSAILAEQQQGVHYEVFTTDNPEELGELRRAGSFEAGRSATKSAKARGSYIYIRLSNFAPDQRWSLERLMGMFAMSGRARQR